MLEIKFIFHLFHLLYYIIIISYISASYIILSFIFDFQHFGVLNSTSQLPSLTSDPEKCAGEPTFIFDSEHFGVLNIEIG